MSDRSFPSRPFVGASVAVFRDGRVLLARRSGGAGAGLVSLPGGIIELGETAEAAALRELKEEVNVEAEIVGLAGHVNVIEMRDGRAAHHFVVLAFAARWLNGNGETSAEASEVVWADMAALGGLQLTKGLPALLRKAEKLVREAQ